MKMSTREWCLVTRLHIQLVIFWFHTLVSVYHIMVHALVYVKPNAILCFNHLITNLNFAFLYFNDFRWA